MPLEGKEINKVLSHRFHECSDLPPLPPLFSCSTCNVWRGQMLLKGQRSIERRDFLSERYPCTRAKNGRGPIKVRVICNSAASEKKQSSAIMLSAMEEKAEEYSTGARSSA